MVSFISLLFTKANLQKNIFKNKIKVYLCDMNFIKSWKFDALIIGLLIISIGFNIFLATKDNVIVDFTDQTKTIDSLTILNNQSLEYISLLENENAEKKETIKIIYREKKDNYINLPIDSRIDKWFERTNSGN